MISKETAIVYRGGGRRWFSKKAAAKAEAKAMIRKRCECSRTHYYSDGSFDPGETCHWHADIERFVRYRDRLARFYLRRFDKEQP